MQIVSLERLIASFYRFSEVFFNDMIRVRRPAHTPWARGDREAVEREWLDGVVKRLNAMTHGLWNLFIKLGRNKASSQRERKRGSERGRADLCI